MTQIEIDVFSDFVCPWCFIGWRRLQAALESFGHMDVVTRHHPYLLYPDVSAEGIDLRASLSQRYRQSPERLFEPVEAAGREAGIPLDFSKVARVYSTVDAHTLARHAQPKGTASAFAEGIFAAYFLEGRNIADRGVLVDSAVRHGFTNAETHALLDDAGERRRTREDAEQTMQSRRQRRSAVCHQRPGDRFRSSGTVRVPWRNRASARGRRVRRSGMSSTVPMSDGAVHSSVRLWLRLEGLTALLVATYLYAHEGGSWLAFAVLFFAPDVSFAGYVAGPRVGAALYNVAHSYVGPLILAATLLSAGAG